MKVVYDENKAAEYKKMLKKYIPIAVIPFVLAVVASVVMCFFVTEDNVLAVRIAIESACVLTGWLSITVFFVRIRPISIKKNLIVMISEHQPTTFVAEIISADKKVTTNDGVKVKEVAVRHDGKRKVVYLDDETETEFVEGDRVQFTIAYNYVCRYEVQNEE